ncbi:tripartite tricarboxylate transporter TctB family protein [Segnochrobactraceae bacterium EtOH-i3]
MSRLDIRELAGGLFLTLTGSVFSGYAIQNYSIGTVTRMGPGMMPTALGILLAFFGLLVVVAAFLREPETGEIRVAVPAMILASVLAFAILIVPFGLIPAVAGCVFIAAQAELKLQLVFGCVLAAALSLLSWLIFVVALQLPVSLFDWPF